MMMPFEEELAQVLPADLPQREDVIVRAARHLDLIVEANQYLNLTRITTLRKAAIKHVLDSVMPWRLFADAKSILDAGSGAGFPGIPLALVFPGGQFLLAESIQKKARFLDSAVASLELTNVTVAAERAEDVLQARRVDIITARAMAPLSRALGLFAPAIKAGARALLYKGPDAEKEIAEATAEARKRQIQMRVVERYELPDALGTRTIVEMSRQDGKTR
jgi:16S rRNA (guanine527-N7)-methyltransferase